jgi:quinol monooxygenase YgiN
MSDLRMDAYYYSFEPTGVPEIDKILSAVACAGKAFHFTEQWNDKATWPDHFGSTPVEWIQNAAIEAAAKLKERRI